MNKILLLIGLIIMSNTLFSQRDNQLEKQVPTFANLSYGTHEQQAFDIWLPSNTDDLHLWLYTSMEVDSGMGTRKISGRVLSNSSLKRVLLSLP